MNLTIELPDDLGVALKVHAQAKGLTPGSFVSRVLKNTLAEETRPVAPARKALKTGFGSWAKYGSAPSAEVIDENRREMFSNFAQDS